MKSNFIVFKSMLFLICFICANSQGEELKLVLEAKTTGVLVYVNNLTIDEISINNTLNLRGKGASISPISLLVRSETGKKFYEVMTMDPVDESTCITLMPKGVHGNTIGYDYIKKVFNLASGKYQVKAIYKNFCEKKYPQKIQGIESDWVEILISG